MKEGSPSPWGKIQHFQFLGRGVAIVDTPSHGGIFVPKELLHHIPEIEQIEAEKWSGSRNWYEEDCCSISPLFHIPDLVHDMPRENIEKIHEQYLKNQVNKTA